MDSTLPGPGASYPRMLRGTDWPEGSSRVLLGLLLLVIGMFLASLVLLPVLFVALLVQDALTGASLHDAFTQALRQHPVTPASMLWLNLSLAAGILVAFAIGWLLHRLPPRWLLSVRPGLRWDLLWRFGVLAVVVLALDVGLSQLSPDTAQLGSHLQPFTGQSLAFALVIVVSTPLQAIGEELAFRGYLLQGLGSLLGTPVGVVGSALVFALVHGTQNGPLFLDRFLFGLTAAIAVVVTGGLEAGIAMHVLNNLLAFGLALAYTDITSTLTVTSAQSSALPPTLIQYAVYLVGVVWISRRRRVRRTTPGGVVAEGPAD